MNVHLACLAIQFSKLDDVRVATLGRAKLRDDVRTPAHFRATLGFPIRELACIEKCNAVIVLVVYDFGVAPEYARSRIIDAWDRGSNGGIADVLGSIRCTVDVDVLRYLAETAVGIHSVVIGDAQVYGQVHDGLIAAMNVQHDHPALSAITHWLQDVRADVGKETKLSAGNVCLERIACAEALERTGGVGPIAVIGAGRSGQLVVKVLAEEAGVSVRVANRSPGRLTPVVDRRGIEPIPLTVGQGVLGARAVILALERTPETVAYVADLLRALDPHTCAAVVDLGSPSLLSPDLEMHGLFVRTIVDLSRRAEEVVGQRATEVRAARHCIQRALPKGIDAVNSEMIRQHVEAQRRVVGAARLPTQTQRVLSTRDAVLAEIQSHLRALGFIAVQTPCIVGLSTDPPKGDAGHAIGVHWPGANAFLRQSNQLYKQMIVVSGQEKIFEIGPFWRGEAERTLCHLEESVGLDVELQAPTNLAALYNFAYDVVLHAADAASRADTSVLQPLILPSVENLPILEYVDAIALLRDHGLSIAIGDDLGVRGAEQLGQIIHERHRSDAVVVHRFPDTVKKFYTYQNDDGTTETFDLILGGWELASGAIRETRTSEIRRRMAMSGIDPSRYEFYLSLLDGAPRHGGFGMGFDRLIAKLIGVDRIGDAVAFPRTFDQLIP